MAHPPSNPHATPEEARRFSGFLAALEAEGLSPATRACYASDWWNVSQQFHESARRRFRIDRYGADEFVGYRAEEASRGVSPATLNRRLSFLRRYAAHALGTRSPFDHIPFQPVPRAPSRGLSADEEERLLESAKEEGVEAYALVSLLLRCGLRTGEVVALRWADVETADGRPAAVHVAGSRRKTVVLPPRAEEGLSTLRAEVRGRPRDPLFRDGDGAPWPESRVASTVAAVARRAGVEATPRTLRHAFAVRYLREHGDDVPGLARALGVVDGTARTYREGVDAAVRLWRWADVAEEELSPRVRRKVLRGDRVEVVRYRYLPGAEFPTHAHPEEQMTMVLAGRIEFRSGARRISAGPGDVVHVPPGVAHGARAVGEVPVVTLNVFTPVRRTLPHVRTP